MCGGLGRSISANMSNKIISKTPSHFSNGCDRIYFLLTAVSGSMSSSALRKLMLLFLNKYISHFCLAVAEPSLSHEVGDGLHELELVLGVGELQDLIQCLNFIILK